MTPNTLSVFIELSESEPNKTRFLVGNSCLEGYVTLCVQFTIQNFPKAFYTTMLPKNMINGIFVVLEKSTLGTVNNSHFYEDYICG